MYDIKPVEEETQETEKTSSMEFNVFESIRILLFNDGLSQNRIFLEQA